MVKLFKVCKVCDSQKNIDKFITDTRLPTGRGSVCVRCYRGFKPSEKNKYWHERDK